MFIKGYLSNYDGDHLTIDFYFPEMHGRNIFIFIKFTRYQK